MTKAEKSASQSFASCSVSAAPLRREPSHRSEQTSQLLFGERVEVLEHNPETDWAFARCAWDGYEGWCKGGQLQGIDRKGYKKEARISVNHAGSIQLEQGTLWVPAGSELTGLKSGLVPAGIGSGKYKGRKVTLEKLERSTEALLKAANSYLHAPYHWGGRTIGGIDCSGLVQMAFKLCGKAVLRDAAQQATMGEEVHFLAEARPGDLAFFDNAEGRIVHVGILLSSHDIIHATDAAGRVVVDKIDNGGIISVSLKRRTHNLRSIRRLAF
jgi:cell wall-associated NlpC family hydrolase